MKASYKCSICETTFTRKANGKRHVLNLNIHFGKGELVALNGQPLGNGRAPPTTKIMMDRNRLWQVYLEERIRMIARKVLAEDYEILEGAEMSKHLSLLRYAIDDYTSSPPSGSAATLVWKLLGLDTDDVDNMRKQNVGEVRRKRRFNSSDLLEMIRVSQRHESTQDLRIKSNSLQATSTFPAPDSKVSVPDTKKHSIVSERKGNVDFNSIDILDILKKDQLRGSIKAALAKALNDSMKERTRKNLM